MAARFLTHGKPVLARRNAMHTPEVNF
jgi:hypothetical protein